MTTSELIAKLKQIDQAVPFDADVVTGDDWNFQEIKKVYHDAPRTFIEFGTPVMGESAIEAKSTERLLNTVIDIVKAHQHNPAQALKMLENIRHGLS